MAVLQRVGQEVEGNDVVPTLCGCKRQEARVGAEVQRS